MKNHAVVSPMQNFDSTWANSSISETMTIPISASTTNRIAGQLKSDTAKNPVRYEWVHTARSYNEESVDSCATDGLTTFTSSNRALPSFNFGGGRDSVVSHTRTTEASKISGIAAEAIKTVSLSVRMVSEALFYVGCPCMHVPSTALIEEDHHQQIRYLPANDDEGGSVVNAIVPKKPGHQQQRNDIAWSMPSSSSSTTT